MRSDPEKRFGEFSEVTVIADADCVEVSGFDDPARDDALHGDIQLQKGQEDK